jgi:hypothetical protein
LSAKDKKGNNGIYIHVRAKGETLKPEAYGYTSPWSVFYNPHNNAAMVGLLQGSPEVTAYDRALFIHWQAPFAYLPRQNDDYETAFRPGSPRTGAEQERDRLGRKPMLWAADVFEHVWEALDDEQIAKRFKWDAKRWQNERFFEFFIDEVYAIEWKIANRLNTHCQTKDGLGAANGNYIWLGGKRGNTELTTRLAIHTEAKGKPLIAFGGKVPMLPGSEAALPNDYDRYGQMLMTGLLHALERQRTYQQECAIRASQFMEVTKGNCNLETLLTAASRVAIHPRVSSTIAAGEWVFPVVKGIVALYFAWNWISQQVSPTWGAPICNVRYMVPELKSSTALAEEIRYFFRSVYDYTEDPRTIGAGGTCYFPSDNSPDRKQMKVAFPREATNENDLMHCIPQTLSSRQLEFANEPIVVMERSVLNLPKDKQHKYMRYPVVFADTRGYYDEEFWLGEYGRTKERRTIVDYMDYMPQLGVFPPSTLVRTFCIGWPIEGTQPFHVSNDPDCPTNNVDFNDVKFELAGQVISPQQ